MTPIPRVGVIVLDFGRPVDTARAARSVHDSSLDARVLIVENGATGAAPADEGRLRLSENRGFAGGMNAGLERLLAEGYDRFLLLNNDATLEPGCLRRLSEALEDPRLAAVGPVILREGEERVESRGVRVDLRWGRVRLEGQDETPDDRGGVIAAEALSGAVMMVSRAAVERVGLLDEDYFFSFEEIDWCVRARRAGFRLAVVLDARARHAGSQTVGRRSPERLYYAARNHLRVAERLEPRGGLARWLRRCAVLALDLAHALRQGEIPRAHACRAVLAGFRDACRGRFGRRESAVR